MIGMPNLANMLLQCDLPIDHITEVVLGNLPIVWITILVDCASNRLKKKHMLSLENVDVPVLLIGFLEDLILLETYPEFLLV